MKQIKLLFLLLLIPAVTLASDVLGPKANKVAARRVIKKTAFVILVAHKKVKENKVYTGDLAKAIAHQKYARKLYRNGKFLRAIHHSRRARFLALKAIKANKGEETSEMSYSKEDEAMMTENLPSDEVLEQELMKDMPGEPMKDEDVISTSPDVDVE
jgi:hypothetical protein